MNRRILTVAAVAVMVAATPSITDVLKSWEEKPHHRPILAAWLAALLAVTLAGWRELS